MGIRPKIPLRLVSLSGRSAYSSASQGLLPFEISLGPIDYVYVETVIEPKLSYLDPKDPNAASQFIRGLSADGWTAQEASVVLKVPAAPTTLEAAIWRSPASQATHVRLLVNGEARAERDLPAPGPYTISIPAPPTTSESITVSLSVDKVFSAAGDERQLGVVITGIGYR
jgi:hypothetical protein